MGWYSNYEVEFDDDYLDWDEDLVNRSLSNLDCKILYLRGLALPRAVVCVYSQHDIQEILKILYDCYFTDMRYANYGANNWVKFKQ
jgi:hypothetical protein